MFDKASLLGSDAERLKYLKDNYPIYDFGANHLFEKRGLRKYDNYIHNLWWSSAKAMYSALVTFKNEYEENKKKGLM